jgi:hypothetical protein
MFLRPTPGPSGRFALLLPVAAFAFTLLAMQRDLNVYDEGMILVGAARVANGDIPHRDFYSPYGPAQFYILAGLFKLFAPSVLGERLWDTLIRALVATVVFLIVDKGGARRDAYLAYFAGLVWLSAFGFYGYPVFPALLFALISTFLLLHVFQGGRRAPILLAGGANVGLVALFRYDVGFITFIAESAVMGAYVATRKNTTREKRAVLVRILLPYGLGIAAVFVPVAVVYLIYAPLKDFVFDITSFPRYAKMRSLPFPTWPELVAASDKIAIYSPIAVWAAALVVFLRGKTKPEADSGRWMALLLGALSMTFYLKGLVRVSVIQMALSIIPALVLLAIVARHRPNGDRIAAAAIWLCLIIAAVPTWSAAQIVRRQIGDNISDLMYSRMWNVPASEQQAKAGSCRVPSGFERIACFRFDNDRIEAIRFLQERTKDDEAILSGLTRHDKIFVNDVMLYFVANRPPATKWHLFEPGLQTTAAIQNEMVSELERKKPRFIVLESYWDNFTEPNSSAVSSGITVLDAYLRSNYVSAEAFGGVNVIERKD